ncbi:PREDICTED: uncharacterized protein LOC107336677 [Acropora digitifera]|uniref:uncharacterized protein LOC107336677 n=1 Tax=Acropora digitifera TaxID=70779 RepID=UPI00077A4521|nr:PREDICTED: uncharacterized protein LOC107336677 [Acropora digitifera]
MLLDDPTKGLNHESTLDLLDIIRRISDRGHLVVATMESIPKGAARCFDQIVLLDDKQIVYSGSPTALAQLYNQLATDSPDKEKIPLEGLNHESTLDLLDIIRRISDRGHLVVATMECIPKGAARCFDQIVLLDDKQIVYSGSPTALAQLYNQLATDSPDKEKMPLEEVVGGILEDKRMLQMMVDEHSRNTCTVTEKVATDPSRTEKNTPQTRVRGGVLARLSVIDYRASLPRSLGERLFLPIGFTMIGITAGIVYWQTDTPLRIMTAYCGSSIPSLLFLCSVVFNRITRSLQTCRQGSAEIVGYSYEHVIQTFTSLTAECVLPVLICAALTYFMVMTSYNLRQFVLVTNISLVLNQTWIALYMLVTFANPSNACHTGFMVAALAGFSVGFVVTKHEMPFGYNFLFYVNPQ